jgi:hypothetical protein
MRKILINEEQERLIMESEMSRINGASLPPFMSRGLESPDNSLKSTGYFLDGSLTKMATARANEVREYFSDDITAYDNSKIAGKLSKLIAKCKKLEEPIKEQLSKICNNVVVEMFGIPENSVEIDCELVGEIPAGEQFHIKPDTDEDYEYDDIESIQASDSESRKRKVINAIAYGAASRMAEQSRREWVNDVFDLNEELPHLYSQIMKINEYLVFNNDVDITDKSHKQGGTVETKLVHEGEIASIHSKGIIFPILLHETIKGVIEILASYGLPDDVNEAKRIVNLSDALENDPWFMRLGPIMWDKVCASLDSVETEDFPYFFKELVMIPSDEFENLMKNVFAGTKSGKARMKEIYGKSKYNNEYDKFAQDLATRRERDVIEDDYFTEEELEEGVYGV